jgi:hypothetical protein
MIVAPPDVTLYPPLTSCSFLAHVTVVWLVPPAGTCNEPRRLSTPRMAGRGGGGEVGPTVGAVDVVGCGWGNGPDEPEHPASAANTATAAPTPSIVRRRYLVLDAGSGEPVMNSCRMGCTT